MPAEYGGLGLGMLQAELDGRLLHIVRSAFQQPHAMASRLLLDRLEHWRRKYALSAQPLDKLSLLPFDVAHCGLSQRSLVHAIMCAMHRTGIEGMKVAALLPRELPPGCRRVGAASTGTPLCSLLSLAERQQMYRECAKFDLFAIEQVASADGTTLVRTQKLACCTAATRMNRHSGHDYGAS